MSEERKVNPKLLTTFYSSFEDEKLHKHISHPTLPMFMQDILLCRFVSF